MKNHFFLFLLLLCSSALAQETIYQPFEVDSAAQPRGGIAHLNAFLQVNLRKPIRIESTGTGGRVVVSGVIEADGHVSNVNATPAGKFPELEREAVRVFSRFNAWQPAIKGGKAVRQQMSFPVMFKPNAPFTYADGAQISYFDANQKPVAEGSQQARHKQVSPLDTNGIPSGDLVVYKLKGTNWKEDFRLPFVRSKSPQRNLWGKPVYLLGHQDSDKQWQGEVCSIDESGTLVGRTYYENGQRTGFDITYYATGLIAERTESAEGRKSSTSWYPNGQIKQVWTISEMKPMTGSDPEQVTAFWDSAGHQLVRDGNGRATYTDMKKSQRDTTRQTPYVEQGRYAGGFKQGIWTGRYADGSYFYEEQYEKGVCQGGKAFTAGGDTVRYVTQREQPEFGGGMPGLGQFLAQNLRYPPDAQRSGIQGKVFISFVVCTDGTLCDYEVLKGVAPSVDQEALRVVKAMSGRWKPGVQRGQKVQVKYNLPINFALQ